MPATGKRVLHNVARRLPAPLKLGIKNVGRRLPLPVKVRAKRMMPWLIEARAPVEKKPRPDFLSPSYKNRASIQDLVYRLAQHDVVSFDVFDTILLRPFRNQRDVFSMLELELNWPGFREDRIGAEKEARKGTSGASKHAPIEVTLRDIYERLHQRSGVDIEVGMQAELRLEARYTRPNEYLVDVMYSLIGAGKQVVLTADTYFSADEIRQLLTAAGIDIDLPIFVSSEHGQSKRTGGLYDVVRMVCSDGTDHGLSFIHVGSDRVSDVANAQKGGWSARLYKGIHDLNTPSWSRDGQPLRSSAALGLIDIKFGNVTRASGGRLNHYAFGYRYAGPMALAYVDWLERRARELHLDQLVFLSPGGYLPHMLFEQLGSEIPVRYLPWSKTVGLHGAVRDFKQEWIDEFVTRAPEAGIETAEELLASLNLSIEPAFVASYLDRLGEKSVDALTRMFQDRWEEILPQLEAATDHIRAAVTRLVTGRRVGVVAIGLSGSDLLYLRSLLNDRDVRGFQFGAPLHQRSGSLIEDGLIENFVFGGDQNVAIRKAHMKRLEYSDALLSVLFDAPHPAVHDMALDGDEVTFVLRSDQLTEQLATRRVLAGALDFATDFRATFSDGPQLPGLSGATVGELYRELQDHSHLRALLRRGFPSHFASYGAPKESDS